MYLDKNDDVCGIPASTMRAVLRTLSDGYFTAGRLAHELGLADTDGATGVITRMLAGGLIEPPTASVDVGTYWSLPSGDAYDATFSTFPGCELCPRSRHSPNVWLGAGENGLRLAAATFAKPVTRAAADKVLAGLLARVGKVNADAGLVFTVEETVPLSPGQRPARLPVTSEPTRRQALPAGFTPARWRPCGSAGLEDGRWACSYTSQVNAGSGSEVWTTAMSSRRKTWSRPSRICRMTTGS